MTHRAWASRIRCFGTEPRVWMEPRVCGVVVGDADAGSRRDFEGRPPSFVRGLRHARAYDSRRRSIARVVRVISQRW